MNGAVVVAPTPRQRNTGAPVAGAAVGAVVGGVIGGPVGAVVGAGVGCVMGSSANPRVVARFPQQQVVLQGGPQVPTLLLSVRIPREAMQCHGGVQYFGIDVVQSSTSSTWRVMKRYRDFYHLNKYLRQLGPAWTVPRFPRKHFFGCTGEKLEERRRLLEMWLQGVLSNAVSMSVIIWARPLHGFFGTTSITMPQPTIPAVILPQGAQTNVPIAPVGQAPRFPTAASGTLPLQEEAPTPRLVSVRTPSPTGRYVAPPAASRPAPPLVPESPTSPSTPSGMMQIQIPEGVVAGQIIDVAMPDGRQAQLKIPEGSAGGSSLTLWFDAISGTISTVEDLPAPSAASIPAQQQATAAGQALAIQVPTGVFAGQFLGVAVPDGRQLNFLVPEGVVQGSTIQLWFDPAAGTLTHTPLS